MKRALVIGCSLLALSSAAYAQVIGDNVPNYRYSVPGVLNTPALATVFQCTNTGKVGAGAFPFEVDVFDATGVLAGTVSLALSEGETKTISTQPLGALAVNGSMFGNGAGTTVVSGAARILGGKKMICTASVIGPGVNPAYLNALPVLKKTTQHGA